MSSKTWKTKRMRELYFDPSKYEDFGFSNFGLGYTPLREAWEMEMKERVFLVESSSEDVGTPKSLANKLKRISEDLGQCGECGGSFYGYLKGREQIDNSKKTIGIYIFRCSCPRM